MNPMIMMAIPAILSAIGGLTGEKAKQGSTYGKGALDVLGGLQGQVKNMSGQGAGDITQNPSYGMGQDWLHQLFNDPEFFKQFEAPIQREFSEQTIPDLANRFGGMGTHGSFGTGFRNAANREATNLHEKIAALRGGMQQQGVGQALQYAQQPTNNYMQMLQQALTPTQNQYLPATPGFGGNIGASMFGGLAQGYGQQAGQYMAGGTPGGQLPTNVSLG